MSCQQSRRCDIAGAAACSDAIGNERLIRRDVVRGHVLDGDLLLPSASVVIEPFREFCLTAAAGPPRDPFVQAS